MPCTTPIITILEPFRCVFSAPTWKKMPPALAACQASRLRLIRSPRLVLAHVSSGRE